MTGILSHSHKHCPSFALASLCVCIRLQVCNTDAPRQAWSQVNLCFLQICSLMHVQTDLQLQLLLRDLHGSQHDKPIKLPTK